MSSTSQAVRAGHEPGTTSDDALMDAADAIADMAQRVQLNGPEPTYASEKLEHALYKAAEGLALCDVDARGGHRGGAPRSPARRVRSRRTCDDARRE